MLRTMDRHSVPSVSCLPTNSTMAECKNTDTTWRWSDHLLVVYSLQKDRFKANNLLPPPWSLLVPTPPPLPPHPTNVSHRPAHTEEPMAGWQECWQILQNFHLPFGISQGGQHDWFRWLFPGKGTWVSLGTKSPLNSKAYQQPSNSLL